MKYFKAVFFACFFCLTLLGTAVTGHAEKLQIQLFEQEFTTTEAGGWTEFSRGQEFKVVNNIRLQVVGVGGTPTSWTVAWEGSLDRDCADVNAAATILTHSNTSHSIGDIESEFDVLSPCLRFNVSALDLGPATSIIVYGVATVIVGDN